MSIKHRRVPRFRLQRGVGSVELPTPEQPEHGRRLPLTEASAGGVTLEGDETLSFAVGSRVSDVVVRVDTCAVRGDLTVLRMEPREGARFEVGCKFHPASPADAQQWKAITAGMKAAYRE